MPRKAPEKVPYVATLDTEPTVGEKGLLSLDRVQRPKELADPATGVPAHYAGALNLIIQSVRDYAIFAQDTSGFVLSWNRGVASVLGYDEEEFLGRHVSMIFTPEDIENGEVDDQMRVARLRGRARNRKWHLRRDGSRFWANGLLMPLWGIDKELKGYVRIIRDDTEQKQLEDERDEMLAHEQEARQNAEVLRASLERAEREKDEFIALLAHELRNPLNTILGWLAIIRSGMADQKLLVKGLRTIEVSARLQDRLIEDVFDFSRIASGNLKLNPERILLNEAVVQTIESIRPAAVEKGIFLQATSSTEAIFVLGDFERIKQAFINVLSNAVKFTPKDGRILITLIGGDSSARLIVEDNGLGFSSEFLPRMFDRYAQANKGSTDRRSGLGLGLPLVREIVERHGGQVRADSAGEGMGAKFTIFLPTAGTQP